MSVMPGLTLALALALGAPAASSAPASPRVRSIAILDVQPAAAADKQMATFLTSALAEATARATHAKVITADEVRALLDAAAAQALTGCGDPRCTVDALAKVLAVDELLVAKAGTVGGDVLVYASVIDTKTASVKARSSTSFARGGPLGPAANAVATRVWSEAASNTGDQLLSSLRSALVFDEAVDGKSERLRPVEACVEEQLLAAGVALVSSEQVANLKGVDARKVIAGEMPAFLTSQEVDTMLVGRIEYTAGNTFAGAVTAEADMALRLVQVDTGSIIVAKDLRAVGNGFNANAARKDAAKKLCADVKPVLATALGARRARGHRVVVTVSRSSVPADPNALVAALRAVKDVATVRLARFDDTSATLDVMVTGGDGVSLALELLAPSASATAGAAGSTRLRVVSAEPSAVQVAQ